MAIEQHIPGDRQNAERAENGFEFANDGIGGSFCFLTWPVILQRPPSWQWKAPSRRPRPKRKK
jgi:hypothetical protein